MTLKYERNSRNKLNSLLETPNNIQLERILLQTRNAKCLTNLKVWFGIAKAHYTSKEINKLFGMWG